MKKTATKDQYLNGFRLSTRGEFLSFAADVNGKKIRIGHNQGFPKNIFSLHDAILSREKILDSLDRDRKRRAHSESWVKHFSKGHDSLIKFYEWRISRKILNADSEYGHLKNHVLPFFLAEHHIINPQDWWSYYGEFKEWLDGRKPLRNNTKNEFISDNTKNNIIKAMHAFFRYLEEVENIGPFKDCEEYPPSGFRDLDDLITDEEFSGIRKDGRFSDDERTYLFLLKETGMRPNEALGLHIESVVFNEWPHEEKWVGKKLIEAGHNIYGYILLKDQPASLTLRNVDGNVPRKPLKCKPRISPENIRLIPLLNLELAKELKHLQIQARKDWAIHKWGQNPEDYLLFSFNYRDVYLHLKSFFEMKNTSKSLYCFRHTFITNFSSTLDGDTRLAEIIVGHTDKKMMVRYSKLKQLMQLKMKMKVQKESLSDLIIEPVSF